MFKSLEEQLRALKIEEPAPWSEVIVGSLGVGLVKDLTSRCCGFDRPLPAHLVAILLVGLIHFPIIAYWFRRDPRWRLAGGVSLTLIFFLSIETLVCAVAAFFP